MEVATKMLNMEVEIVMKSAMYHIKWKLWGKSQPKWSLDFKVVVANGMKSVMGLTTRMKSPIKVLTEVTFVL